MENFFLVCLAYRCVTDDCHALGAGIIGIIYREHDPIDAKLSDATGQRRRLKVSAGRQIKMLPEGVGECARAADVFENPVTAPQREWNSFAEMAEDDFQPRESVKHPADNQSDGVNGGLGSKAPGDRQKRKVAAAVVGVIGVSDGMVWDTGV